MEPLSEAAAEARRLFDERWGEGLDLPTVPEGGEGYSEWIGVGLALAEMYEEIADVQVVLANIAEAWNEVAGQVVPVLERCLSDGECDESLRNVAEVVLVVLKPLAGEMTAMAAALAKSRVDIARGVRAGGKR